MGKKFIDKKSATTYNLVYRSQEDPLAFEEGSTDRVFVEAARKGARGRAAQSKHADQTVQQSLRDLQLDDGGADGGQRQAGEAALYGIFLDDRNYDYTKHLRAVGTGGGVLLEAPSAAAKEKRAAVEIRDAVALPAEVLPSQHRMDIRSSAVPRGLQLDMDPEVREALEALDEDDADELDDGFMEKLNADELSSADEEGEGSDGFGSGDDEDFDPEDVFAQVRRMKARRERAGSSDDDGDEASVGGSTGFSMSSSAMFRNDKLTLLDEQYERVEAMYEDSGSEGDEGEARYDSDGHYIPERDADGNVLPASTRPDFEAVLDEFLAEYELTGKKMQAVVEGGSGAGKLGTFRNALLEANGGHELGKQAVLQAGQRLEAESRERTDAMDEAELDELFAEKARPAWDCESILSTYSTLENHPATIYEERTPRIRISRKSGLPLAAPAQGNADSDDDDDESGPALAAAPARPANETRDEKRERKRQVQEAKRDRRQQKKETREVYAGRLERQQQSRRDRQQFVVHLG
ncbi:Protein ltv1 [Coemansia helicoidea]|uniref:Protein ltv1 n=1 Tax=Coemansia helicoidea TaxID=1286919 RepID=A0ACC1L6L1_9FUNG|nr:Protein ltv1 [Coemansia helicoidea]